jgi:hypothetical protein
MTPEVPKLEVGSFGGAPIFTAPGLMGGYPAPMPTVYVVRNTDLKKRIENRLPLPHHEGDPDAPDVVTVPKGDVEVARGGNYIARPIEPYALYVQPGGDGSGFGDVLAREPEKVKRDLDNGVTSRHAAEKVYGVVFTADGSIDMDATKKRRDAMRAERLMHAVPADQYRAKVREKFLNGDLPPVSKTLFKDTLANPGRFRDEFLAFWDLPSDFTIN